MSFLKTTLLGGVAFLLPVSFCVFGLVYAYRFVHDLVTPLARFLPQSVVGISRPGLLAVLALVLVCFLAGLLARSQLVDMLRAKLDAWLSRIVPGYAYYKGTFEGVMNAESRDPFLPVLARFDDSWQIAFLVERLADGRCVVYLPGSPNPVSGTVSIMDSERIQPLEQTMNAVARSLRALGRGSGELIRAVPGNSPPPQSP